MWSCLRRCTCLRAIMNRKAAAVVEAMNAWTGASERSPTIDRSQMPTVSVATRGGREPPPAMAPQRQGGWETFPICRRRLGAEHPPSPLSSRAGKHQGAGTARLSSSRLLRGAMSHNIPLAFANGCGTGPFLKPPVARRDLPSPLAPWERETRVRPPCGRLRPTMAAAGQPPEGAKGPMSPGCVHSFSSSCLRTPVLFLASRIASAHCAAKPASPSSRLLSAI